jgi:hypothetical protein
MSSKERQERELACKEVGFKAWKLKTRMKTRSTSKVILFQETLEFSTIINLYYSRQTSKLQSGVPLGSTWAIGETIIETLRRVVK